MVILRTSRTRHGQRSGWFRIVWLGLLAGLLLQCQGKREPLPELGTVAPLPLTNQEGQAVDLTELDGKVWVAAFMFTRCPSICPGITRTLRELQVKGAAQGLDFHLVSFSVDPEHDTPPVLKAYAAEYGADLASWSFLTGDSKRIQAAANESFKIGVDGKAEPGKPHFGLSHGSHFVLLDSKRTIRGFFRSSEAAEMERLLRAIAELQK